MTRVKVCGLTREDDVRLAVSLGAWACGFVVSESPRRVSVERARRLVTTVADALCVGVVTTEAADWIAAAAAHAGFDAVQLSAGADGPSVAEARAAAARLGLRPLIIAAADTPDAVTADYVLLDSREPGRYGGTGQTLDWEALARRGGAGPSDRVESTKAVESTEAAASTRAAAIAAASDRLILAGGLTADNVARAVATLRPYAVDVAGGAEREPGQKDGLLMEEFFAAAARAQQDRGAAQARRHIPLAPDPPREVAP